MAHSKPKEEHRRGEPERGGPEGSEGTRRETEEKKTWRRVPIE
jgi:hypothetical protein